MHIKCVSSIVQGIVPALALEQCTKFNVLRVLIWTWAIGGVPDKTSIPASSLKFFTIPRCHPKITQSYLVLMGKKKTVSPLSQGARDQQLTLLTCLPTVMISGPAGNLNSARKGNFFLPTL